MSKAKLRKILLGSREKNGLLLNVVVYTLLISIGFVYLYPILHMFATSLMRPEDILDAGVRWIPSTLHLSNYRSTIMIMDYWNSLWSNIQIALFPTIFQILTTSMAGYAFARYDFPLKKLWLAILLFSFVVPPQITMIPTYVFYNNFGIRITIPLFNYNYLNLINWDFPLIGSIWAFIFPSLLGQGFQSAIFILIFYNFHRQVPKSLIEAAEIDGAGHVSSFFRISTPLAVPALVVTTLFSFVWYWNDIFWVNLFLGPGNSRHTGHTTILLELQRFQASHGAATAGAMAPDPFNEALRMAGTMLAILPLIVLYLVLQRQFVQSVDKAGITGE